MRHCKEILKKVCIGICVITSQTALAQNVDISVFNGSGDDFLLPSYFDAPTAPVVSQQVVIKPADSGAPQSIPSDVDILNEIFGENKNVTAPAPQATTGTRKRQMFYPTPKIQTSSNGPLLTPLDPIPPVSEPNPDPPTKSQYKSAYASKFLAQETIGKGKAMFQVPKEMRLIFDENSTHLSESVVKWIKAYSLYVQKDPRLVFNIRISNQNWPLQRARLGLIMRLAIEKGLSAKQIRVYQSNRDVNSMILSAETDPNQTQVVVPMETKRVIKDQKSLIW